MRTARVEQSIGSQRATRLCSIVEPSEHDETVPPIGKLTACDDKSYLSELGVSVLDSFRQAERVYAVERTLADSRRPASGTPPRGAPPRPKPSVMNGSEMAFKGASVTAISPGVIVASWFGRSSSVQGHFCRPLQRLCNSSTEGLETGLQSSTQARNTMRLGRS